MVDGTSKTIIVVESKEPAISSWYDGTASWVVATPLGNNTDLYNASYQTTNNFCIQPLRVQLPTPPGGFPYPYFWLFQKTDGTVLPGVTALNYGPKTDTGVNFNKRGTGSTPIANWSTWLWGPSSDHSGGTVMHAWADAHVSGLPEDIDANVYLHLCTRSGKEPDSEPQ